MANRSESNLNSLPADVVKATIQKNLLNIARKAASGKTLSSRELSMLEASKQPDAKRRIVESISAAAILCETTEAVVKHAKKMGCSAFEPGNRIDVPALRKWLKSNSAKLEIKGDNLSLKDQKLNEEVRKLRRANDIAEGKFTLITAHEAEIQEMADSVTGVVVGMADRHAVSLAGQPVVEVHARLTAIAKEVIGKLSMGESK